MDEEKFRAVQASLGQMTDDAYKQAIERMSPELDGGEAAEDQDLADAGWPGRRTEPLNEVTRLVDDLDGPSLLSAYLACALTGLNETERQLIFQLSHDVSTVSAKHGIEVYEPRNISDPERHRDMPDWQVWKTDRDRVLSSDLLVHLAHFPSTGSGEELSFAYDAMVPIIVVSHAEHRVSRMVTGIPGMVYSVTYVEPEDLAGRLTDLLAQIRPVLVQRRTAMAANRTSAIGQRIRAMREARGLTISELVEASKARVPMTERMLQQWESSTDQESNLSIVQLRELSVLLGVSISELVEPSLETTAVALLERYVNLQAARGHTAPSDDDLREIRRTVLNRLIDKLDV